MSEGTVVVLAIVVVVAALRSTWSPCGRSMPWTITPLTERGRGHRFAATAGWLVAGAALGGAVLGGIGAFGAALDTRLAQPELPHLRRQVDEV